MEQIYVGQTQRWSEDKGPIMSDFTGWLNDLASQYRSRIRDKSAIRFHLCIKWKPCGGSKADVRALSWGTALVDRQPQESKEAQMAGLHCVLTAGPSKPASPRGPKGPIGPYRERGGREGQITDMKAHSKGANIKKHNHITEQKSFQTHWISFRARWAFHALWSLRVW